MAVGQCTEDASMIRFYFLHPSEWYLGKGKDNYDQSGWEWSFGFIFFEIVKSDE